MTARTRVSPYGPTGDEESPTHPLTAGDDDRSAAVPGSRATRRRGSASERRGSWFEQIEHRASLVDGEGDEPASEEPDGRSTVLEDLGEMGRRLVRGASSRGACT